VGVIYGAWSRLRAPPEVNALPMLAVAFLGLGVNLLSGYLLHHGARENINLRAAFLHVAGDALASVGAMAAGLLMWWQGWMWADPLASVVISVIILVSAFQLMNETIHLILQGVPLHLDTELILQNLKSLEGVAEVHHLHVWGLSSDVVILTVHLVATAPSEGHRVLTAAQKVLKENFGISHTTIQVESSSLKEQEPHFH
jgi:cobalt-zinc-cadmium efflux system protein